MWEWSTGRCTVVPPAPKQEQSVKKQKSHTVILKKFRSLEKIFLLSAKQAQIGLTSHEQNAQNQASVKLGLGPQIEKTEARLDISVSH